LQFEVEVLVCAVSKRTTVLTLSVLVTANLVVDVGLFRVEQSEGFLQLLFFVAFGVALSQILLLAVWLACAEGSCWRRFGIPVVLTAMIGYVAAVGLFDLRMEPWAMVVFPVVFQFPLFGLASLLWPICRMRGWRLTAGASATEVQPNQFRIGDLLAWMTIIGVLLALVRFLFMSGGGAGRGIWLLLAFLVLPAPLLWFALLTSLSVWPNRSWWLVFQILTLVLYSTIAFAICARMLYDELILITGSPGYVLLPQCLALTAIFFGGVPSLLWLNCIILRMLGFRLIRPASRAGLSPVAAPVGILSNTEGGVT
jgi:hypothetical protein